MKPVLLITSLAILIAASLGAAFAQTPSATDPTQAEFQKKVEDLSKDVAALRQRLGEVPQQSADTRRGVFWFAAVASTGLLVLILLGVVRGLAANPSWFLGDAVSEEVKLTRVEPSEDSIKPAPTETETVMRASSSRLIGVVGMTVIVGLFLGVGYYVIWDLFTNQGQGLGQLGSVVQYFLGGGVLFVPYVFNKIASGLEGFGTQVGGHR